MKEFSTWLASYDMRPGSLFEGVAQRLTIVVSKNETKSSEGLFVGGYRRWVAEERPVLIALTSYTKIDRVSRTGPIPKLGSATEKSILKKIAGAPIEQLTEKSSNVVVVHRIVRYFIKALNFIPLFIGADKVPGKSEDYKEFRFDREHKDSITALLNSSLFYWFWRTHSDGFHCGYNDVYSMPYKRISEADLHKRLGSLLKKLMKHLSDNSERRAIKTKAGQIQYQEFYMSKSKTILDEIDAALAPHYEFTEEELDFIKNYDVKYRLGRDTGDEDGDE